MAAAKFLGFEKNKRGSSGAPQLLPSADGSLSSHASLVKLKFETLPVVVLEVQQTTAEEAEFLLQAEKEKPLQRRCSSQSAVQTVGYLSVEFRSDVGVSWHFYRERPPGKRKLQVYARREDAPFSRAGRVV